MPVSISNPKVKKILRQCERRIRALTENPKVSVFVLYSPPAAIPYEEIEAAVCEVMGVSIEKAVQPCRDQELVMTRHLIAFYARDNTKMPLKAIAKKLNKEDHTTIISSVNRIKHLLESGDLKVCGYVKLINQHIEQLKTAS